jgi:hypothetical protein
MKPHPLKDCLFYYISQEQALTVAARMLLGKRGVAGELEIVELINRFLRKLDRQNRIMCLLCDSKMSSKNLGAVAFGIPVDRSGKQQASFFPICHRCHADDGQNRCFQHLRRTEGIQIRNVVSDSPRMEQ